MVEAEERYAMESSSEAEAAGMIMVEQNGKEGRARGGSRPSAKEREKTKLRERQRRSITTKIFSGLRKYGGYNLPPRADINDVLRALAAEAGFVVEPDGTTYRAPQQQQHQEATLGGRPFPASASNHSSIGSFRVCTATTEARGGVVEDSSTTASPRRMPIPVITASSPSSRPQVLWPASGLSSPTGFASPASSEDVTAIATCRSFTTTLGLDHEQLSLSLAKDEFAEHAPILEEPAAGLRSFGLPGNFAASLIMLHDHDHGQNPLFREAWASNRSTPTGSPLSQMKSN